MGTATGGVGPLGLPCAEVVPADRLALRFGDSAKAIGKLAGISKPSTCATRMTSSSIIRALSALPWLETNRRSRAGTRGTTSACQKPATHAWMADAGPEWIARRFDLHGRDGSVTVIEGSQLQCQEVEALRPGHYRCVDVVLGM